MMPFQTAAVTIVLLAIPAICVGQQHPAMSSSARIADCSANVPAPNDHANMDHAAHLAAPRDCAAGAVPIVSGQAAFGAISEVVRILKADPTTDWAKVNLEALRQHLIDMDDVTMHSVAKQRNIPGGIEVDITGTGPPVAAIQRMTINHTAMLDEGNDYHALASPIVNGARLTITVKNVSDASIVARIRGLGFAGIMTEGEHHAPHHIAIARGEPVHRR